MRVKTIVIHFAWVLARSWLRSTILPPCNYGPVTCVNNQPIPTPSGIW